MEFDKVNGNVGFVESAHKYLDTRDEGRDFISVTQLIERYTQPYDSAFWSAYKAIEKIVQPSAWPALKKALLSTKAFDHRFLEIYHVPHEKFDETREGILDAWAKENKDSLDRGTKIHQQIENSCYDGTVDLKPLGLEGSYECLKDHSELDLENAIYPEYLLSRESDDGILRIAGQADMIVKEGNLITIIDHKGLPTETPILTTVGWTTLDLLEVGDQVYDMDGKPCRVKAISNIHFNPCYKIHFANDETITADHEHRWLLADGKVVETKDLKPGMMIPVTKPLQTKTNTNASSLYAMGINAGRDAEYDIPLDLDIVQRRDFIRGLQDSAGTLKDEEWLFDTGNKDRALRMKILFSMAGYRAVEEYGQLRVSAFGNRIVDKIEELDYVVPTKCIETDSPTHTYLADYALIVTHNTNKEIKVKGYYDPVKKMVEGMKYPLSHLPDTNYWHYALQLSTYAWMLRKLNPEFIIKDLILNHYDHEGKNKQYHCDYLEKEVEMMLRDYKKSLLVERKRQRRQQIVY